MILRGKRKHLLYILILFILSLLVTISNLGLKKSFVGDDVGIKYVYKDTLFKYTFNVWDEYTHPGVPSIMTSIAVPFTSLILLLYKLGFNDIFLARLLYFLFFFLASTGTYLLFVLLVKNNEDYNNDFIPLAALTASILYSVNYFTMVQVSFPLTNYHISYALFPLIFYLYIKNFHYSTSFQSIFILALVLFLFFSGNPANSISTLVFIGIWALLNIKRIKVSKKYFLILGLLVIFLSSHIILTVLTFGSNPYINNTKGVNIDSLRFNSYRTSFNNLFRMQGFHSAQTFSYNDLITQNIFLILLGFLPIFFVIYSMVIKKPKKIELFLLGSVVIFLFLAKGVYPPFDELFRYVFEKIFVLQMYRATYAKLIPFVILSLSVLLGFFILKVNQKYYSKQVTNFLIIFPILICINSWPLINGSAARYFHLTELPNEYNEIRQYLSKVQLDYKVISLPQIRAACLKWEGDNYFAGQYYQDSIFLDKPVWSTTWFDKDMAGYFSNWDNLMKELKILPIYNIKFILIHKDIPEKYDFGEGFKFDVGGQTKAHNMNSVLNKMPYIKRVKDNKYLTFYEIENEKFLPHIYTPEHVTVLSNNIESITQVENTVIKNSNRQGIYLLKKFKNIDIQKLLDNFRYQEQTTIEFKKINASKYKVNIYNSPETLPIIFSESYNPKWKMFIERNKANEKDLDVNKYRVLDENNKYQMTTQELKNNISKISTLGNGKEKTIKHLEYIPRDYGTINLHGKDTKLSYEEKYTIDFVSKNISGTIQNNNIEDGKFYDTWNIVNYKKLDKTFHTEVNGYANSWILNASEICLDRDYCVQNLDGTYNFSLVIEFTPQKYFVLGLYASGLTFITGCLISIYEILKKIKRD